MGLLPRSRAKVVGAGELIVVEAQRQHLGGALGCVDDAAQKLFE